MVATAEWLTATPMIYGDDYHYWERDAGLLCLGLRARGHEARFVALGETTQVATHRPLITGRLENLHDPGWWGQWGAKGVLLNAWAAPRHEPIARAIKGAGMRLITRLDSDGCKSPRTEFFRFLAFTRSTAIDGRRRFPTLYALAKTLAFRLIPQAHDRGMLVHLTHADRITIESPVALSRFGRLLETLERPDLAARLELLPHPVSDLFNDEARATHERQIVAIGRWDTHQKDGPRLLSVLHKVLTADPACRAAIVGGGTGVLETATRKWPEAIRSRVRFPGRIPHEELRPYYHAARILLVTSRHESFHIAAEEALCCGCSVVGPAEIPSMHWFTSDGSGTLAPNRSTAALALAVGRELAAWESGQRDSAAISRLWRERLSAANVAGRAVDMLGG